MLRYLACFSLLAYLITPNPTGATKNLDSSNQLLPIAGSDGLLEAAQLKSGRTDLHLAGQITLDDRAQRSLRVCPKTQFVAGCEYDELSSALADAEASDIIVMASGTYERGAVVDVPGVIIRGEPGAHLRGGTVKGKAALVVTAKDVVIEGIECSEMAVRDRNGACIRIEGENLTVRNVYFHDNQEGILGGGSGTLIVEDSRFERNGFGGQAHGVYIGSSIETFIFRNNQVLSTTGAGHGYKSRAQKSIIEGNIIASLDGHDSRAIDLSNGGEVIIRGNILQKGPNSENYDMIGLALEGTSNKMHTALIENNIIIFDLLFLPQWKVIVSDLLGFDSAKKGRLVRSRSPGPVVFRNNTIIGAHHPLDGTIIESNNRLFRSRNDAGMQPFPHLPEIEAP